jgi:virginiamycin B lyase
MNHHQPSPPRHPTPCATFARLAPLLNTGELESEREAWAREHLRACASCRRQFADYEITTAALRRHYGGTGGMRPSVTLPAAEEMMKIADMEAFHEDSQAPSTTPLTPRPPQRRKWRGWRPLATALTAAMVLAVIGTLFALRGPSHATGPTAGKTPHTSSRGKVVEISLGGKLSSPTSIAVDKNGSVWVLDPQKNAIGCLGVAAPTARPPYIQYVWVASTANSGLAHIAIASDGSVWFTESNANKIGRIIPDPTATVSTSAGTVKEFTGGGMGEFTGPNSDGRPLALAPGSNGVMWLTELNSHPGYANSIVPIYPDKKAGTSDETFGTILMLPYPDPGLLSIARAPDGALWITEANTGHIDRLDPVIFGRDSQNALQRYALPHSIDGPIAITVAPDGSAWFLGRFANAIWRMSSDGKVTEFPVPWADHALSSLAAASDGSIWFTAEKANQIGHLIPSSGAITEIAVPTTSAGLRDITIGPDGKVWFTETASGKIGYVAP